MLRRRRCAFADWAAEGCRRPGCFPEKCCSGWELICDGSQEKGEESYVMRAAQLLADRVDLVGSIAEGVRWQVEWRAQAVDARPLEQAFEAGADVTIDVGPRRFGCRVLLHPCNGWVFVEEEGGHL